MKSFTILQTITPCRVIHCNDGHTRYCVFLVNILPLGLETVPNVAPLFCRVLYHKSWVCKVTKDILLLLFTIFKTIFGSMPFILNYKPFFFFFFLSLSNNQKMLGITTSTKRQMFQEKFEDNRWAIKSANWRTNNTMADDKEQNDKQWSRRYYTETSAKYWARGTNNKKCCMNSCVPEGLTIYIPLVTVDMLLLNNT